ncbi:MAG: hypothetical protein C4304_07105, partial [candidate division GAL15 bacterium]
AAVLAASASHRVAFLALALPAALCLMVLARARAEFPRPSELEPASTPVNPQLAATLGPYLVGVALVAGGFVDFPLLAYHFMRTAAVTSAGVPLLYALAMAADAVAALVLGRWFDRRGPGLLSVGTAFCAWFAPLAVFGGLPGAVLGTLLWGAGLGLHESVLRAAVAQLAPSHRRAASFGLFHAVYGLAWFAGSVLLGALYDRSPAFLAAFAFGTQLAGAAWFFRTLARTSSTAPPAFPDGQWARSGVPWRYNAGGRIRGRDA